MAESALMRINEKRCEEELCSVEATISRLLNRPAKVDFYSVAAESGVSRSTLYRNSKLRLMVEAARDSQSDPWELIGRLTAEIACLRKELEVVGLTPARGSALEYNLVVLSRVA